MFGQAWSRGGAAALVGVVGVLFAAFAGGSGAAAVPGCGAYKAQGDAQDAFMAAGGSPAKNVGKMDPDRDGVACEALGAPFKGYATIGYNLKKRFFYGIVTMPAAIGGGEAPCLYGNRSYPDSNRRLNIFKVRPEGDKALLGRYGMVGAQADAAAGKLVWKVDRANLPQARYYVSFEERIRSTPDAPTDCPGFSSRPTLLPAPKR